MVVHCLACGQSGQAVENPRQVPALRYSPRYGPLPPCFSRGTIVTHPITGQRALLVAGTASILGERTVHASDLGRQMDQTLANLRALLAAAEGTFDKHSAETGERWRFTDIRAYHTRRRDAVTIERFLGQALGQEVKVQMVLADLCRKDLLVEIEGLATQQGRGTP